MLEMWTEIDGPHLDLNGEFKNKFPLAILINIKYFWFIGIWF